jgi:hypothetical protein
MSEPVIDKPPFEYWLLRLVPESDFAQGFSLGPDGGLTISLIRAATESRQVLPAALFDGPDERLLIDFLCGDPLGDLYSIRTPYKPHLWLCRGLHRPIASAKLPLIGQTQRAFESLLYLSLLRKPRGLQATDREGGALMFVLGFPLEQVDAHVIPF